MPVRTASTSPPVQEPVQEPVEEDEAWAVLVTREALGWRVDLLPDALVDDLDALVAAVRQQGDPGAFALVDVADEFFVVVRVDASGARLLLSDVTAAVDFELAAQVLDALGVAPPEDDELDDVWPAGDLDVFADLGLEAVELGLVLSDVDAYADEVLDVLARRLGFAEPFERVVAAIDGWTPV